MQRTIQRKVTPSRPIAERVMELLVALYFKPVTETSRLSRDCTIPSLSSRRMLKKLGLTPESFGKKWTLAATAVQKHATRVCRRKPECRACPLVSFCDEGRAKVAKDTKPVAIDLFGGAGGLGSGFAKAGFRVGLAIEIDRDAAQTYRLNNPGTPVIEADVTTLKVKTISALVQAHVSVVCAGPPCQSFSAAGPRRRSDPRHGLFRCVLDIAHDLEPELVLIENVPGVARILKRRQSYKDIIAEELGRRYEVEVLLLNAAEYGVPQLRNRYIFIGRRQGSPAVGVPRKTHTMTQGRGLRRTPTVLESLRNVPNRRAGDKRDWHRYKDGAYLRNLTTMAHSARVVRKIRSIRGGEGPISYRRVPSTYAKTLISGHRALPVHPRFDRTISVREAACIQAFPLDYVFLGKPANQPLQVANAVPPPMASAVARGMMAHIHKGGGEFNRSQK